MEQNHRNIEMNEQEERGRRVSLRGCGCLLSFILFFCIVSLIGLLVSRPPFVINPGIEFLNQGAVIEPDIEGTSDEVIESIEGQITELGENTVLISEDQLTVLLRDNFPQLQNPTFNVIEQEMQLFIEIPIEGYEDNLIGYLGVEVVNENSLEIASVGTPNIQLPDFLKDALVGAGRTYLNLDNQLSDNLLVDIFGFENASVIQNITLKDSEVELVVLIEGSLYD